MEDIFACYRILVWRFSSFHILKMFYFHFLDAKSTIILIFVFLYIMCLFLSGCFHDFVLGFSRGTGKKYIKFMYIYICFISMRGIMHIYFEELSHVIMEVEKFYDFPSASWRPQKAGDVILV